MSFLETCSDATADVLDISQDLVDELVAHAAEAHPREACGVLVGPADRLTSADSIASRMRNASDCAEEYSFEPEEQLVVWLALEAAGECPWDVYHSHPSTRA